VTTPEPKARLSEKLVQMWSDQLFDGHAPAELKYLTEVRGFTPETLKEYQIGWDGHRITFPIRDRSGALVDCKRYKRNPKAGEDKSLHLRGWGSPARLAFLDRLPEAPEPGRRSRVLICGGEWDALAAMQEGFVAVAPTSGESALPREEDLEALAGWPVALCLDDDTAGRKAAKKWVATLLPQVRRVRDVRLGIKDVNDWFLDGRSAKELSQLIKDTPAANLTASDAGGRRDADELRRMAVEKLGAGESRNVMGLWLACQLRDERYTEDEALEVMQRYQAEVTGLKTDPYTLEEARNSLQQAFSQPPRTAVGRSAFTYMRTDVGNAQRLVARHHRDMRYVPALGGWFVWTGRVWQRDENDAQVMAWAKATVRAIYEEARQLVDLEDRKALAAHAKHSESAGKLKAMLTLAQSEPGVPARAEDFDKDPMLFNCVNGVVDLRTGELHDHRREDMCRKIAPVAYDPRAQAPLFEAFLRRVQPGAEIAVARLSVRGGDRVRRQSQAQRAHGEATDRRRHDAGTLPQPRVVRLPAAVHALGNEQPQARDPRHRRRHLAAVPAGAVGRADPGGGAGPGPRCQATSGAARRPRLGCAGVPRVAERGPVAACLRGRRHR
jgi:hypothetical protein